KNLEKSLTDSKNESVSLVVLDLDHFKHTNDTYGHQAGNEVLKQVANVLTIIVDDSLRCALWWRGVCYTFTESFERRGTFHCGRNTNRYSRYSLRRKEFNHDK